MSGSTANTACPVKAMTASRSGRHGGTRVQRPSATGNWPAAAAAISPASGWSGSTLPTVQIPVDRPPPPARPSTCGPTPRPDGRGLPRGCAAARGAGHEFGGGHGDGGGGENRWHAPDRLASGWEPPMAATYSAVRPAVAAGPDARYHSRAHQVPAAANKAPPTSRRPVSRPARKPPVSPRAATAEDRTAAMSLSLMILTLPAGVQLWPGRVPTVCVA